MKQKLLLKTMLLLFALIAGSSSVWAKTAILTNAQIVAAGSGDSGYKAWAIAGGGGTWNAYAIKNQHSNATSSYHFLQIKKYASNTAYYIQVPELGTKITSITMTVSGSNQPMTGGSNSVALYFSASNSTSATGTGVASGTGTSSVTIDCSSLNLNTGYITAGGAVRIWDVTVTYTEGSTPQVSTPTFSPAAGVYTSAQDVEISTTTDGATIYYTTDGTAPTTNSSVYSSAIPVSTTTTIKAIAVLANYDDSSVASATYTILDHAGTEADPYSVADARAAIDANTGLTGVYVTGIVCEGGSSLSNGAMNYWISDDGTEANKFEIYLGKGIGGADFTATSDVKEGDIVVVTGTIKKHNSTYEFDSGSQLVSLTPSAISSYTFDLSTNSSTSATENLVTWASNYATMTLAKGSSSIAANNYLANSDAHTRMYKDQILKITPVPGYSVTKAVITAVSGNVPGFTGNDWTNASKSTNGNIVTITPDNGKEAFYVTISAACRATAVKVYYEDADGAVVTITDAGWASFSCTKALDFTGTGVTAYIAKEKDASSVMLTEITKVPANTGIVVNASEGTYAVPVLTDAADATTGNLLQPWLTAGTPTAGTYYTLAVNAGNPIFKKSSGGTLAAGKAYLDLFGASAPVLNINFGDGNTTSVSDVRSKMEEGRGEFYNLNGQRVAQPTKGLYIVNGKKVIIK